jgi:hypothetical protein
VKGFFCFRAARIYSCKRKNKKSRFLRSKKAFDLQFLIPQISAANLANELIFIQKS